MGRFVARLFSFDSATGFGFVPDPEGDEDVFVHVNELSNPGQKPQLRDGVEISFEIVEGSKGLRAEHIEVVAGQGDPDSFRQELTERLIDDVPSLTGEQIAAVRRVVLDLHATFGLD